MEILYKKSMHGVNGVAYSLQGFCRWSLGVGIPLAIVWVGGIVLVMLGGLGVSMCLQQIEFYIVVGTLWNLIVATPGASLFMTIMIVGNIGVLTQYLEKEIRSTGALIACAYLIVWTVPFGCLGYNIFGYIGLLPLLGVLSVPVFRLCVGSMLLGMGHAGVFVRSFETFTEDFRAGIFLLWHGLRYKNWSEGTKVQFFNALGLIAFFVMAVTHQEVYLMASPETWEEVFRALKWQDIPTRDGSWRDIPINQLIGEKGEIKISLQEATPDEVKRILFWRLGEAPEALGAAGYGVWHIALGFIGGVGTCLSLILLFKGGPTPPPPPLKDEQMEEYKARLLIIANLGQVAVARESAEVFLANIGDPEVARLSAVEHTFVLMAKNRASSTEGVKGSPSVAALVKMAVEGSSDKKGRVDSIPVIKEEEIPPVQAPVKNIIRLSEMVGLSEGGFYSREEKKYLEENAAEREVLLAAVIQAGVEGGALTEAGLKLVEEDIKFYFEFAKFIEIYPDKGREIVDKSLKEDTFLLYSLIDKWHKVTVDNSKEYSIDYMAKHNKDYNEAVVARAKVTDEDVNWLARFDDGAGYVERCCVELQEAIGSEEAKNFIEYHMICRTVEVRYMICLSYQESRYPSEK